MYVDGGWRAREGAPRRRRITERQERLLLALIGLNLLLMLVAPIGGSTIVSAIVRIFAE